MPLLSMVLCPPTTLQSMQTAGRVYRRQRPLRLQSCCCTCNAAYAVRNSQSTYRQSSQSPFSRYFSSSPASPNTPIASTSALPPIPTTPSRSGASLGNFFRSSFLKHQAGRAGDHAAPNGQQDVAQPSESPPLSASTLRSTAAMSHAISPNIPAIATPTAQWRTLAKPRSIQAQLGIYKQLAKGRLSAWIVLTAMAGYAMCPTDPATAALAMEAFMSDTFGNASILAAGLPKAATNSFHVSTLLATAVGTGLCSASANTFNQLIEIPYDSQMPRTAKRPLPSHLITPLHAFTFGTITGIAGTALLYTCVNPLVASLGLLNIVLYAGVYTPLKRLSVVNTWVGAVVGGIPPLMGWAACTNSLDPFGGQAGAWVLALILFAWQFPHFNALSWTIRSEYARGGYRMLSAVNPAMNARVSLRWTIVGAAAAAIAAPMVGLTSWAVGIASLIPSGALGFYAWRFWRAGSASSLAAARKHGIMKTVPGARATDRDPRDASARSLFFVSLVHLPALLFMLMASKLGFDYVWQSEPADAAGTP